MTSVSEQPRQLTFAFQYCWDRGDGRAACGGVAQGMALVDRVVQATCERCRSADEKAVVQHIVDALSLAPSKRRSFLASQALRQLAEKKRGE
jgi:hypothetical protein